MSESLDMFRKKSNDWNARFEAIICEISSDKNSDGKYYLTDPTQVIFAFQALMSQCAIRGYSVSIPRDNKTKDPI